MPKNQSSQRVDLSKAIAYLKAAVTGNSGPMVELSLDDSPVLRDLGNGLVVSYVIDQSDRFQFVQQRHLLQSGLSEAALHQRAVGNLANFCRSSLQVGKHSEVFAFLCGGNFEASLLLVDGLWDRGVAHAIEPPYVAAIPARDILAVCSERSRDGIRELQELVDRVTPTGDHLVTSSLYIRESAKWRVYRSG